MSDRNETSRQALIAAVSALGISLAVTAGPASAQKKADAASWGAAEGANDSHAATTTPGATSSNAGWGASEGANDTHAATNAANLQSSQLKSSQLKSSQLKSAQQKGQVGMEGGEMHQ